MPEPPGCRAPCVPMLLASRPIPPARFADPCRRGSPVWAREDRRAARRTDRMSRPWGPPRSAARRPHWPENLAPPLAVVARQDARRALAKAVGIAPHRFEKLARPGLAPEKMRRLQDQSAHPTGIGEPHQQRDHRAVAVSPDDRPIEGQRIDQRERLSRRAMVEVGGLTLEPARSARIRSDRERRRDGGRRARRSDARTDRSRSPIRREESQSHDPRRRRDNARGPATSLAREQTRAARRYGTNSLC